MTYMALCTIHGMCRITSYSITFTTYNLSMYLYMFLYLCIDSFFQSIWYVSIYIHIYVRALAQKYPKTLVVFWQFQSPMTKTFSSRVLKVCPMASLTCTISWNVKDNPRNLPRSPFFWVEKFLGDRKDMGWLVVSPHLKNMKVNWDDDIPNINGKIKDV